MNGLESILGSVAQFVVFFGFCALCWLGHKALSAFRKNERTTLFQWLGLTKPTASWRDAIAVIAGLLAFGALLNGIEALMGWDSLLDVFEADSPAAKAAAIPSVAGALSAGLFYAYVQTGGAEELVVRGLLYKRFIGWFGYLPANLLQSFLFAILHNLIVHLAIEDPPLWMHGMVFLNLFVFSFVLGWYMEKRDGGSLFMPWFFHGLTNFKTFLVYWLW